MTIRPLSSEILSIECNQSNFNCFFQEEYAARYAFEYKIRDVNMRNEFGHEEKREGENANGIYHVALPDGRMQKVEYHADDSGYHAKVTYEKMEETEN